MLSIVIVGHVDHGKSTLIGRLLYDTGSVPDERIKEIEETARALGQKIEFAWVMDALEEERRKKMTIESAYYFFTYKGKEYAIIDAPGHKELIKNMATGASQADAAILLVAADEGIKEQTKRHAFFLKLLGIKHVIVAINKMDLVDYSLERFDKLRMEIENYLNKISLPPLAVVPISAYRGENVVKKSAHLPGPALVDLLEKLAEEKKSFDFRMPVQDVFEGYALGNVLSGEVQEGEDITILPSGLRAKVLEIKKGLEKSQSAKTPEAIGVKTDVELKRGDVLVKGNALVKSEVEAAIFCLAGEIKEGETYRLRCSSQQTQATIDEIKHVLDIETLEERKKSLLEETDIGVAKLSLARPLVFEPVNELKELGRFVLTKDGKIVAGGIIHDTAGDTRV